MSEVTGFVTSEDPKTPLSTGGHPSQSRLGLVVPLLRVRRHARTEAVGSRACPGSGLAEPVPKPTERSSSKPWKRQSHAHGRWFSPACRLFLATRDPTQDWGL